MHNFRAEIDRLIAGNQPHAARSQLNQLWQQNAGPAVAGFVASRAAKLPPISGTVSSRVAFLRSFTLEPVVGIFQAAASLANIRLQTHVGEFNAYVQELLNEHSSLYAFSPDVIFLAVQTRDIAPKLWHEFASLTKQQAYEEVEQVSRQIAACVKALRSIGPASLVIHTFEVPADPSQGIYDAQSSSGQFATIRRLNDRLREIASQHPSVYVLEYDELISRHGRRSWHDERKWTTMRMPLAVDSLVPLAQEWLRYLHPLCGRSCKVLVTDLDNTLWGGVVGEDGPSGIQIGVEYPGAAFHALQQVLVDFRQRGILLAICSKNNPADAYEVLDRHPGMLLRSSDFSAIRINWTDKAQNLREIAAELNVGLDSLAFLDDNPIERECIRSQLPEVTVIDLPSEATQYRACLRLQPVFERLSITADDRERGQYYLRQRQRDQLAASASDLEQFFCSLEQTVEIARATEDARTRIAQLTQKTNQFNLTTRRYQEAQIADLADSPNTKVYSVRVRDRFGDNGIIAVVIVRTSEHIWDIDTFLMSCRVIGRTVETGILAYLVEAARSEGARQMRGWFIPTKKNAPARDFYQDHGFTLIGSDQESTHWSLDLPSAAVSRPSWLTLITPENERNETRPLGIG